MYNVTKMFDYGVLTNCDAHRVCVLLIMFDAVLIHFFWTIYAVCVLVHYSIYRLVLFFVSCCFKEAQHTKELRPHCFFYNYIGVTELLKMF